MQSSALVNPKTSLLKLTNIFNIVCLFVVIWTQYFMGTEADHSLVYWNPADYVLAGFLAQGWGLILSTKWSVLLFALQLTHYMLIVAVCCHI